MSKYVVLAYDIESAGDNRCSFGVFSIGVAVRDDNNTLLDKQWWSCMPKDMLDNPTKYFETRCWNDFWEKSKQRPQLMKIYEHSISLGITQKQMITGFIEFVKKWENYASTNGVQIYRGCDNTPFDTFEINTLIQKYIPYDISMVLPYKLSERKYGSHYDIHKIQYGFLLGYYLGKGMYKELSHWATQMWGHTKQFQKEFNIPACEDVHDHLPHNDASTIAYDMVVLLRLCQ